MTISDRSSSARRPEPSGVRRGFTIGELMIALVIGAILLAMGVPKLRRIGDRNDLRGARDEVASMVAVARAAAIQKGRPGRLHIDPVKNQVKVTVDTALNTPMVVVAVRPLDSLYRVTLKVTPATDTMIPFDARGFASTASQGTVHIGFAGRAGVDSLCVARYGLVTKGARCL